MTLNLFSPVKDTGCINPTCQPVKLESHCATSRVKGNRHCSRWLTVLSVEGINEVGHWMRPDKHAKAAPTGSSGWCEKILLEMFSLCKTKSVVAILSPPSFQVFVCHSCNEFTHRLRGVFLGYVRLTDSSRKEKCAYFMLQCSCAQKMTSQHKPIQAPSCCFDLLQEHHWGNFQTYLVVIFMTLITYYMNIRKWIK